MSCSARVWLVSLGLKGYASVSSSVRAGTTAAMLVVIRKRVLRLSCPSTPSSVARSGFSESSQYQEPWCFKRVDAWA